MTTASCWGGPLDGLKVVRHGGAFRWFNEDGRSKDRPLPGYFLYRWAGDHWDWAGHLAIRCWSCKAIVVANDDDSCPLCGKRAKKKA